MRKGNANARRNLCYRFQFDYVWKSCSCLYKVNIAIGLLERDVDLLVAKCIVTQQSYSSSTVFTSSIQYPAKFGLPLWDNTLLVGNGLDSL